MLRYYDGKVQRLVLETQYFQRIQPSFQTLLETVKRGKGNIAPGYWNAVTNTKMMLMQARDEKFHMTFHKISFPMPC